MEASAGLSFHSGKSLSPVKIFPPLICELQAVPLALGVYFCPLKPPCDRSCVNYHYIGCETEEDTEGSP
jgi:hypothetical protein